MAKATAARTTEGRMAAMPVATPKTGLAALLASNGKKMEIVSGRHGGEEKKLDDGTTYDQLCATIKSGVDVILEEGVHFGKESLKLESLRQRISTAMGDGKRGKLRCDAGDVRLKNIVIGTEIRQENGEIVTADKNYIWLRSIVSESEAAAFREANGLELTDAGQLVSANA